eukprot:IDg9385t1
MRSGRYVKEIIPHSRRYGTYEVAGDPGFGNVAAHGFSVSFYPTVERRKMESAFGRSRAGRLNEHEVPAVHNENLRETVYLLARYKVLFDYRNTEADLLTDEMLFAMYMSM